MKLMCVHVHERMSEHSLFFSNTNIHTHTASRHYLVKCYIFLVLSYESACTFGLLLPLGGRAHMMWWGQETHSENKKSVLDVTRRVHHRSQGCSAGCKDG